MLKRAIKMIMPCAWSSPRRQGAVSALPSLIFLSLIFLSSFAGLSAPAAEKENPPGRGPAIGTKAPTFTLADANGRKTTLADLAGKKGAILLFYRSADW